MEKKKTSNFRVEIGHIFKNDKRNLIITKREYIIDKNGIRRKWYTYTCNICGWKEGIIEESHLLNREHGCSCCCNRTPVLGINTIWDTDKWMCDLGIGEEDAKTHTHSSNNKIEVTCPYCGKNKVTTITKIYYRKSIACLCSDKISYPNKFAYELLGQLNKIYNFEYIEHEYSPDWIKPKRYDNYFIYKGKEYILEMDGSLGHGKKQFNKNSNSKEKSIKIDNYKDKMAQSHKIEVIRIDCELSNLEYIRNNILNDETMSKLFDLSKIDWLKVEEFALSNLVKIASDYWNNGINNTKEISNIMNISTTTVCTYLKKASNINLCKYNPKQEISKGRSKSGKMSGKQVFVFKDFNYLGYFPSVHELARQSEKLFGVKFLQSCIGEVCLGRQKTHKGFTFKYTSDLTEEEIKQIQENAKLTQAI